MTEKCHKFSIGKYKMKRFFMSLGILAAFIASSAAGEETGGAEENGISRHNYQISDKTGKVYKLQQNYAMKKGRMLSTYALYDPSDAQDSTLIYKGWSDGESGGCGRWETLDIENAILDIKFAVLDMNGDNFEDLIAHVLEKDCRNNNIRKSIIVLYSSDRGFAKEIF